MGKMLLKASFHVSSAPKRHYREMETLSKAPVILTPETKFKETPESSRNELSTELQRLLTFLPWDTESYGALQSLLAKAGFFYTGEDDIVECFACGVRLSDWNPNKDPVKEHAAASPTCIYMNLDQPMSSLKSFSLNFTESPENLPVQDSPNKFAFTEKIKMQFDLNGQQSNNNPVQIEALQSLPAIKSALPSNDSYRRQFSYGGEDTTDMFSIADPKEQGAHPRIDLLRIESRRIQTFQKWPSNAPVTVAELARSGFFYVGPNDRVQCAFCRGILRNWAPGDSAMFEHKRHFPSCGFIRGASVGNVPLPTPAVSGYPSSMSLNQGKKLDVTSNDADMYEETGIIEDLPKHPEFAIKIERVKSFKNWPQNVTQTPELLAECGFYSLGIDDSVKCFFCDGGLRSWEPNDDPWVEHARWFKKCGYLRSKKGHAFIQEISERMPSYPVSAPELEPVEPMVTSSPENDVVNSLPGDNETPEDTEVCKQMLRPDFQEVFSIGFSEGKIRQTIRHQYRKYGKPFANTAELVDAVLNYDENSSSESDNAEESKEESQSGKVVSKTLEVHEPAKDKVGQGASQSPSQSTSQSTSQPGSSSPSSKSKDKKKRKKRGEAGSETRTLEEEIRVLKEERVCKVCLDESISIVFLPCGHMVCCGTCAPALRVCPICRENIKGNVKAFIA